MKELQIQITLELLRARRAECEIKEDVKGLRLVQTEILNLMKQVQ